MAQTVSVVASTSAAQTGTIVLNPVAKSTTVILVSTGTATSTNCTVQIEMSVQDPSALGAPTAQWATLSSGTAMSASAITSLTYTVLSPIAQVRINSTSGSTGGTYAWTMQALQSVTA